MAKTIQERFEDKFTKSDICWEWSACKTKDGYGQFRFHKQMQLAHRIAYHLYVGEIPVGMCVCHRCDNPSCVNPVHLFLGTHIDNMLDRDNKGRDADHRGEKNGHAKLINAQVVEIRKKHSEGATQSELAKEFGVSQSTISHILCGETWESI